MLVAIYYASDNDVYYIADIYIYARNYIPSSHINRTANIIFRRA